MRRPANIFLLAVVIAAIGAAFVYRYLRWQQEELERARALSVGDVASVAVAAAPIEIGTRLKPEHIKLVKWPKEATPPGSTEQPEAVVGKVARIGIRLNQPFNVNDLTTESAGILPMMIEDGMRAVSVKVDKVTGVSGFITPNSRVDVVATATVEQGESKREYHSRVIVQNVRVLATGTHIEQQEGGAVEVPTVTLLITPEEAEKLAVVRKEPVVLALRGYRDADNIATQGMSIEKLFLQKNGSAAKPRSAAPTAAAAPQRRGPSVEVLLGETRTRQPY